MVNQLNTRACFTPVLIAGHVLCAGTAQAAKISGTISATLTVNEDSQLVGDVTCTVTGVPSLDFTASNVTLEGLVDPQTGCAGSNADGTDQGNRILNQTGLAIRGPGVVQRFRAHGIVIKGSTGTTVTGVTTSTNCLSGILVAGGFDVKHLGLARRSQ